MNSSPSQDMDGVSQSDGAWAYRALWALLANLQREADFELARERGFEDGADSA